jgi:soluble lytic murein transglycosylase-like protein
MGRSAWCALALLCIIGGPARADIYSFTDERGVVHFSNVPNDSRYKLYLRWHSKPSSIRRSNQGKSWAKLIDARRRLYGPLIEDAARNYALESELLHAVITAESAYNPDAVSRKGARGLMQLMPETAQRYGVINIHDPVENIRGGARYLRDLLQLFNDLTLAIAAYNAGEGAVMQYGNQIPPYSETRTYVSRVLDYYRRYQKTYQKVSQKTE